MKRFNHKSRLERVREKKELKKAVLFLFGSFLILFLFISLGIPFLGRVAVFLGNLKSQSTAEKTDIIPPSPPSFSFLPEATSSAQLNLVGYAEPESTVTVFLNGIKQEEVVVDKEGSFSINLKLSEGENEIYASTKDAAGNESLKSEKQTVILDTKPPELEILSPADGETFYIPKNKIEIKGKTEPNVVLMINDHQVILNSEGEFTYPFTLSSGENKIKLVATDKSGNQTEKEITLFLE